MPLVTVTAYVVSLVERIKVYTLLIVTVPLILYVYDKLPPVAFTVILTRFPHNSLSCTVKSSGVDEVVINI